MTAAGRCACGAVRFSAFLEKASVGMCHCRMCRRWCGGLPLANTQGEVQLESADSLRWWKSSPWGERGFCGECGSSLFWRVPGMPSWGISAGALDNADALKISGHIFVDDKADFYDFADDAPRQTGAQHTAKVLSDLAKQFGDDFLQDALKKSRAFHGDKFADQVEKLIADSSAQS